jgi:hypothetical protein
MDAMKRIARHDATRGGTAHDQIADDDVADRLPATAGREPPPLTPG